jgi:phosphoglycolate phosphatase-like HAD superfamily hydrolase
MVTLFAWDFHGTLAKDNELALFAVVQRVLPEFGISRKISLQEITRLHGQPWGAIFKTLSPDSPQRQINEMIEQAIAISARITNRYIKPMPHAQEVLAEIKAAGHVNAIVSNMRRAVISKYLDWVGIASLIDAAPGLPVRLEQRGFDIAAYKSAQLIKLMRKFNTNNCFMIGDQETDIEAGLKAGAITLLLNSDKNVPTKAHYVVTNLKDILLVHEARQKIEE